MAWQKLSSVVKYRNRYMTVTEDELVTDHGDHVTYGTVHKNHGVSIIPYDGDKFYLIRQYRFPVDYSGWEFPAGHMEHASLELAARAELEEEVGLRATQLAEIGSYYEAPGHLDQEIHIFLATGLTPGSQQLETSEKDIVVKTFSKTEIDELIKKGEIKDGLTIVALKFFELQL